ncbi:MAG: hypothetical protein Q4C56_07085 [Peptococcaceae bacterium]|nr:hypothetical protein [Peptococcaceae bacterium]
MKKKQWLAEDVKCITIETDEEEPVVLARIDEFLTPSDGVQIRITFVDRR